MGGHSRRSFLRYLGVAVAAGIAGAAGGYALRGIGIEETARRAAEDIVARYEKEISDLREKISQYEIKEREVRVYWWSETIPEQLFTVFQERTGVKVIFDSFDTSDEVFAKLSTGSIPYDVISITPGGLTRDEYDKYLLKLDWDKIPNFRRYAFKDFLKEILNPPFDPKREYTVPLEMGTTGVSFRTDKIAEEDYPTGFIDSLFDFEEFLPKYSPVGGVKTATIIPGGVETIPVVIKAVLGRSINDISESNVREAVEVLKQQKPFLATYAGTSEYIPGLAEARFWVSETWVWQDSANNVDYVAPAEGSEIWEDSAVIPKAAKNVEAAHAFINFMLEPTVQVAHVLFNNLVTPNALAYEMLPEDVRSDPSIYPPAEIIAKYEMWLNRTPEQKDLLIRAWNEVLVG
jgi:spermidine/putrescine-binding protein